MEMYPKILSASLLLDMVLDIHKKTTQMDDDGLRRMVCEFGMYELHRVPLDRLSVMFVSWLNDPDVLAYANMDLATSPPIVLSFVDASTGKHALADGTHRAVAHYLRRESNILAYVPVLSE